MKHLFERFKNEYSAVISRLFFLLLTTMSTFLFAQQAAQKEKPTVTYEELYDEPYSINKLFIGFQPIYGEVFATNTNAGFGAEASYMYKDKFDLKAHFRKSYSSQYFDNNRHALEQAQNPAMPGSYISNTAQIFHYYELGGTYHIKDFDQDSKTKLILYKKSFKGERWAATVPQQAEVPCKVRKIYGLRVGAIQWASTTDLTRALKKQHLTNADLKSSSNPSLSLPTSYQNTNTGLRDSLNVFSNISATNVYLGGSMSWIRNVAISFDKYESGIDDGMMTLFFDIIYAPALKLNNVTYTSDPITQAPQDYSTKAVKLSPIGFRLGIDGKFNRTFGWSYGGEVGSRPTVKGMGFYAMFKIAFPLYGTTLDNKVESFGK